MVTLHSYGLCLYSSELGDWQRCQLSQFWVSLSDFSLQNLLSDLNFIFSDFLKKRSFKKVGLFRISTVWITLALEIKNGGDSFEEKTKVQHLQKFWDEHEKIFPVFHKFKLGDTDAFCTICCSDISVTHGGKCDLQKDVAGKTHRPCKASQYEY